LNGLAAAGKIDPLIGREKELSGLSRSFAAGAKNNPLLVGEAGVGKTAIAEGLAYRIVEGEVPDILAKAQVLCARHGRPCSLAPVSRRF